MDGDIPDMDMPSYSAGSSYSAVDEKYTVI